MAKLFLSLRGNIQLQKLMLDNNLIEEEQSGVIPIFMGDNKSLKELSLSGC